MALHLSLFLGSFAVLVTAAAVDEKQRLVRKEEQHAMVGARGELVDTRRHVQTENVVPEVPEQSALKLSDVKVSTKPMIKLKVNASAGTKEQKDYCDFGYLFGLSGTNECGANTAINDPTQCVDAAESLGAEAGHLEAGKPFTMVDDNSKDGLDVYPAGCFRKWDDPNHMYYNPFGDTPTKPYQGTPVCSRPKYTNGTAGQNECGAEDTDYEKILDEEDCRTYAACNSKCTKTQFTVGEEVEHEEGWYTGDLDESCSDTCSKMVGLGCNAKSLEAMKNVSSSALLTDILNGDRWDTKNMLNGEACPSSSAAAGSYAPYKVTADSQSGAKNTCAFSGTTEPRCESMAKNDQGEVLPAGDHYKRFCYCAVVGSSRPSDTGPEYYDRRPQGCFLHPSDNCVYFNVPRAADPAPTAAFPMEGVPICQVKLSGWRSHETDGLHGMTAVKSPSPQPAAA